MKTIDLGYSAFIDLVGNKSLLLQYSEDSNRYFLFAIESNIAYECTILKDSDDAADFEGNYKTPANKPLEYRSTDGLLKTAPAKFVDALSLWIDGSPTQADLSAGSTAYVKWHFSFTYTISGVDVVWYDANWGDYVDFEVGYYTDESDESTFVSVQKFGNQFKIYKDWGQVFDVPTVKQIPSTVSGLNLYIRAKVVNVGSNPSKVIFNVVGWR